MSKNIVEDSLTKVERDIQCEGPSLVEDTIFLDHYFQHDISSSFNNENLFQV